MSEENAYISEKDKVDILLDQMISVLQDRGRMVAFDFHEEFTEFGSLSEFV